MRWWGWLALLMVLPFIQIDDREEMRVVIGRYSMHIWNAGYLMLMGMLWWSAWQR